MAFDGRASECGTEVDQLLRDW